MLLLRPKATRLKPNLIKIMLFTAKQLNCPDLITISVLEEDEVELLLNIGLLPIGIVVSDCDKPGGC